MKSTKFAIFRRIFREIFRLGCYSSSYSMLGLVRGRSGISVRRNCWKGDVIVEYASHHQQCIPCLTSTVHANLCPWVSDAKRPIMWGFTAALVRTTNTRRCYRHSVLCIHVAFHSHQECGPIYCDFTRYSYACTGHDGQFRAVRVDSFTRTKSPSAKRVNDVQ